MSEGRRIDYNEDLSDQANQIVETFGGVRMKRTQNNQSHAKRNHIITAALVIVLFLGIWELICRAGWVSPKTLAPPTQVIATFFRKMTDTYPDGATLPINLWASLSVWAVGFFPALIVGVLLGWLMGFSVFWRRFFYPLMWYVLIVPAFVAIPLALLWIGVGLIAKSLLITWTSIGLITYFTMKKTKTIPKRYLDAPRVYGASKLRAYVSVLPWTLPGIIKGTRMAVVWSWCMIPFAELLAANAGIGFMMNMGQSFEEIDLVILGMALIGAIVAIFWFLLNRLENYLLRWRRAA